MQSLKYGLCVTNLKYLRPPTITTKDKAVKMNKKREAFVNGKRRKWKWEIFSEYRYIYALYLNLFEVRFDF